MKLKEQIKIARGGEPADLLLKNGKVINVYSGEILQTDVAIVGTQIIGLGDYDAKKVINLDGHYVAPGLIDSHVHIESAMVSTPEFAKAVVPRGTTTVVTDPHEIGNVFGLEGIRYMIQSAKNLPLTVFINAPSCIPSTHMETTGAVLDWQDLDQIKGEEGVLGLAEVMNYPGVIRGEEAMLRKIRVFQTEIKDGHCPGLKGRELNAYILAGIGSDHECTNVDEALEKLRLGMVIFIREATNARNLRPLLPLITSENARRICLCTDDRQPADLLEEGHLDYMIRTAVAEGIPPITVFRMATLNPAEYFRLYDRGAVAPGKRADLMVFSDLQSPQAEMVFSGGKIVASEGEILPFDVSNSIPLLPNSINVDLEKVDFSVLVEGRKVRVIGAIPGQLLTESLVEDTPQAKGMLVADVERDILRIAVIERHHDTGRVGMGLVKGVGLDKGAIASTIAHDHHNIVVIGADEKSMMTAVRGVVKSQGGMAAAEGEMLLARLPLPIAGLMSDQSIVSVRDRMEEMLRAAHQLGSSLHDPFMAMSFLALPVIPSLKLTDHGLVDVDRFELVPLFLS